MKTARSIFVLAVFILVLTLLLLWIDKLLIVCYNMNTKRKNLRKH